MGTQLSLVVLITGLVVVFAVLICLTVIVKGFGTALHSLEAKLEHGNRPQAPSSQPATVVPAAEAVPVQTVEDGIPGEVVAAIAAAVFCMFPEGKVTSVKRSQCPARSAWSTAGLMENTRPF